jgi:predicted dehydrogenase
MASDGTIRVAIVGLGFGAEFIPIYQNYPGAEIAAICRRSKKDLDECGERWKIAKRYTDFDQVIKDPAIDAVHINSPIQDHARQSVAALKAGKHVACTVPMGTTVEECRAVVEAQRASGKVYMMMETVVYSREYLFVKELYETSPGSIARALMPPAARRASSGSRSTARSPSSTPGACRSPKSPSA